MILNTEDESGKPVVPDVAEVAKLAHFLRYTPGINKTQLGEFLGMIIILLVFFFCSFYCSLRNFAFPVLCFISSIL